MRRRPWAADDVLTTGDGDRLPLCARHSVRLPILNWVTATVLAAIAATLVVLTCEPERPDQESQAWSRATGHPQAIWALAFTSDGRRLATGSLDTDVVIWEVGKGASSVLSVDRPSSVPCLAFSPDGATLAAGYDGNKVVLWNVLTGKKRATFHGHHNQFLCLAFSPDGRTLASGGAESSIRIWDVVTGRTKTTLIDHHGSVSALRFAPDGQTLASGCASGMVKLWELRGGEGRDLMESNMQNSLIRALAFSPDGLMLAAGSEFHGTRLWSVVTGRECAMIRNENEGVSEVAFSSDGQMLVEVTRSPFVRLLDAATGSRRTLLRARGAYCSAITPDARFLAAGDDDAMVRVWGLAASPLKCEEHDQDETTRHESHGAARRREKASTILQAVCRDDSDQG
jgi:WD40 repeat protein